VIGIKSWVHPQIRGKEIGELPATGRLLLPKVTIAFGFAAYPFGLCTSVGNVFAPYKSWQVAGTGRGHSDMESSGWLSTNGGLKRPSNELDCTRPLKATHSAAEYEMVCKIAAHESLRAPRES